MGTLGELRAIISSKLEVSPVGLIIKPRPSYSLTSLQNIKPRTSASRQSDSRSKNSVLPNLYDKIAPSLLSEPASLARGVSIYKFPPITDVSEISTAIALNSGIDCIPLEEGKKTEDRDGFYFPKSNWRLPTEAELELFDIRDSSSLSQTVYLFTIPEALRRQIWQRDILDLLTPPGERSPAHPPAYNQFVADLVTYLDERFFHISPNYSFTTVVTRPGLSSSTTDPYYSNHFYGGLHFDNFDHLPANQRHMATSRMGINLGDEERYFVMINLTFMQIFDALRLPHTDENYNRFSITGSALANLFLSTFPSYPVTKITLQPGEGYLAPTQNIIHDGYTFGKTQPDVNFLLCSDFTLIDQGKINNLQ